MYEHRHSWNNQPAGKRALVVRYGAIGDLIQASSVFPLLKAQGYHVTLNTTPAGENIARHDPNIDAFLIQDKDQVPNHELSAYWAALARRYDRFINLSESVEGSFLALPGRANHAWPDAMRRQYLNVNYQAAVHDIAQVPHEFEPRFWPSNAERDWARRERDGMSGPVILVVLSGSSVHKAWPHMDTLVARVLVTYPKAVVVMTGDFACQLLERGWEDEPRVLRRSGVWSVRETLSFAECADLVIGPETGVLNAVATLDMPKIVMLSHSSATNLTLHWRNTTALTPKNTACYPCHRMHYGWEFCHREETTHAALCAWNIDADTAMAAVVEALNPGPRRVSAETQPLEVRDDG
jgi:ADP-heptose:LPS heptosyltransferase